MTKTTTTREQAIAALVEPNPKGTIAEESAILALKILAKEWATTANRYRAAMRGCENLSVEIGRPLTKHEYMVFSANVIIASLEV